MKCNKFKVGIFLDLTLKENKQSETGESDRQLLNDKKL